MWSRSPPWDNPRIGARDLIADSALQAENREDLSPTDQGAVPLNDREVLTRVIGAIDVYYGAALLEPVPSPTLRQFAQDLFRVARFGDFLQPG